MASRTHDSGPVFHFSDTWQLVINTGTTIVTFLMVFLIQNTQNRDGAAIQAKLDELIRVTAASNSFSGIEHLTVEEVNEFRARCKAAAEKVGRAAVKEAGAKAKKAADEAASGPDKEAKLMRNSHSELLLVHS
jgi:low affinity Fe/Cu permease